MKGNERQEIVRLYFPNIDRTFDYTYPHDLNCSRLRPAMQEFYDKEADELFALYGYAPIDISVLIDGIETWSIKACYQETLWHSFFREGGDSWSGSFSRFTDSLMEFRWRDDKRNSQQLKAA